MRQPASLSGYWRVASGWGLGLVLLLGLTEAQSPQVLSRTPESWMSTTQLAAHRGYGMETYSVQTTDGYLLTLHRLLTDRAQERNSSKGATPVLFVHCLACSADVFLIRRKNDSLVLALADLGFDVWLINMRGSIKSRHHVSLSVADSKYWDFSWHENGCYDLTATIDYILEFTKQPSLLVVTHSMGGAATMVLLSERPEYNKKVKASFLMAPPVLFRHLRGMAAGVSEMFGRDEFRTTLRNQKVVPVPLFDYRLLSPCVLSNHAGGFDVSPVCTAVLEYAAGPFHSRNHTLLSLLLRHWPEGVAWRQFQHFLQLATSGGVFRKYDFGPKRNWALYGTDIPPAYNLKNVISPCFIFYSVNDYQVHPEDVQRLISEIPGLAGTYKVPHRIFNHFDYLTDEDAFEMVYAPLIEKIIKYL